MSVTSIQWTDRSLNPIRARDRTTGATGHYCQKISSGCANCYASRYQPRRHMPKFPGVGKVDPNIEIYLDEEALKEVLSRRMPAKWFWADMSDLFGDWVSDDMLDMCFATMALARRHTHQVLTKRIERAEKYLARTGRSIKPLEAAARKLGYTMMWEGAGMVQWPLPNLWLGCSVENQQQADERIPHLLQCPAAVRFLSVEPLLGPVELDFNAIDIAMEPDGNGSTAIVGPLHWIIVGGESGPGARQCKIEWIRDVIKQCKAAGVACFVKQLGGNSDYKVPGHLHAIMTGIAVECEHGYDVCPKCDGGRLDEIWDKKGGDWEEWTSDLRVREFPKIKEAA